MMRFEYDPKFIKLLAKEMVKEMQKVKDETKEPELITVKEAAQGGGVSVLSTSFFVLVFV